MRPEEAAVLRILHTLRPEWDVEYAESQSNGECDFLVTFAGERVPLEVTSFTSARFRQFHARIRGGGTLGQSVARCACVSDWIVMPSLTADMREVRAKVAQYLANIEQAGHVEFDIAAEGEASPAVQAAWRDLRVPEGFQVPGDEGLIHFELPSQHAILSEDQIAEAVRYVSRLPDNLRKLSSLDARERHLVILLDFYSYPTDEAMRANLVPAAPPDLPRDITHVWLARAVEGGARHQVWLGSAAEGWCDFGVVDTSPRAA
jgi:hypothetical protein